MGFTNHLPFFDERFNYYGNDKVYYYYLMDLMKFKFFVDPNHFIVHNPHELSSWSKKERDYTHIIVQHLSKLYTRQLRQVFEVGRMT